MGVWMLSLNRGLSVSDLHHFVDRPFVAALRRATEDDGHSRFQQAAWRSYIACE